MNLGCSSFSWETENQKHLLGRTYDQFGNLEQNRIAVIPKNFPVQTRISQYGYPMVNVTYAFAGMAVTGLPTPIMVDGINEKGLMGALLNYPGYAVYNTKSNCKNLNIHPAFLTAYLLGKCSTIDEVAENLSHINLTGEKIFEREMDVHFIFSDSSGESIIIEPDAGGIRVHRNTIGVLTNSPDYLWHKTNLRNYTAVTNLETLPVDMIQTRISCFGEGVGGGFGLPGSYSSPARFVRMALLKNFAVKGKDEIDGVTKMFHNFASVDIPEGILKSRTDNGIYEQTLCISAMCAESLTYYFSTSSNRRISAVSLEHEKNNSQIKYFYLQEKQDISYLN